jgi:hypothetical protein
MFPCLLWGVTLPSTRIRTHARMHACTRARTLARSVRTILDQLIEQHASCDGVEVLDRVRRSYDAECETKTYAYKRLEAHFSRRSKFVHWK